MLNRAITLVGSQWPSNSESVAAGDLGLIPGLRRCSEKEMANTPVFLLAKSMDTGDWQGWAVHGAERKPDMT